MPWHVTRSAQCPPGRPYAVVKDAGGSVVACHLTRESALAQVAALYANEPKARAAMADLLGVEIARPGQWDLSTGPLDATVKHLADAAAFSQRPDARPAPVKLGHTDPRFDGEPALGWLTNLRVEGEAADAVLLGDIFGMPDWLAEVVTTAYPDRSLEGWSNLETSDGRTYALAIDGLSLLGVTPPGMSSIRSLRDLPQALGVAASARIAATVHLEAATVSDTPWSDFSDSDYTDAQYARACVLDRGPGAGTAKQRYSLPVREPSGALNRNGCHAAAAALAGGRGGVNATPEQIAAAKRKLASLYRNQLGETPPDSLSASADGSQTPAASASGEPKPPGEEEAVVAFSDEQLTTLRQKLGTAEDADEATILAALDEALTERADPPQVTPPEPVPAPVPMAASAGKIPEGAVVLDKETLERLQEQGRKGEAAAARLAADDRDRVIHAAIYDDHKFAPSRAEHWRKSWDADPEGTKQLLASMPKDMIPTQMRGTAGDPDDLASGEFDHMFSTPAGGGRRG